MKLAERTIEALALIITGDRQLSIYRSGPKLISFFNKLGFNEVYGEGFPSRWKFAEQRLRELNGTDQIQKAIEMAYDPRNFIDTEFDIHAAIEHLNEWLKYDGYEISIENGFPKITDLNGQIISVETEHLNINDDGTAFIDEQLKKSEDKISDGDYDGAITNARSLIEAVLMHLEVQYDDNPPEYDGNVVKLYNRVRVHINLSPADPALDNSLKQVLTGLSSIINGIASISNKMGDRHARSYRPSKHHAILVVNSARTFVNFIFDSVNHQSTK